MNHYNGYILNAVPYWNMLRAAEKGGKEKQNLGKERYMKQNTTASPAPNGRKKDNEENQKSY